MDTTIKAGARQGLLLIAIAWLAPIGSTLFAPVLPHMIAHFSAVPNAALLAPVALATPALFIALLAPVAGMLADRFGRRRVLLAALPLYAVAGVSPYWIDNLYVIIATRALVGIAEAGVMTACTSLICDYFSGQRRAHWLSVQFGSAALVATVCFALAGFLGGFNWRAPFIVYGATALFIPLVLLVLFEPRRNAGEAAGSGGSEPIPQKVFTGRFIACLLLTMICGVLFYITPVHISLVLSERGFSDASMFGLVSSIGSIGVVTGAAFFRFQSKRPIGVLLCGAMAAQAIGYSVLYTQSSLTGAVAGMFINNVGCGISLPLLLAFTMKRLPDAQRGRATGLWTSMFSIGQFLCPLFFGGLSSLSGGMVASLVILAGLTGAFAGLLLIGSMFWRSLHEPAATAGPVVAAH